MTSSCNYSVSQLRDILIARGEYFFQLYGERFEPLDTILQQHLNQTGVLTIEHQDLIQRLSDAHDAFAETYKQMEVVRMKLESFLDLPVEYLQQQLRDQISATFPSMVDTIGVMINNYESQVEELEIINIVATGTI